MNSVDIVQGQFHKAIRSFAFDINAFLSLPSLGAENMELVKNLDAEFEGHRSTNNLTVFRGCNFKEMYRFINLTHKTYIHYPYMSTSTNFDEAVNFASKVDIAKGEEPGIIKINIPAGANVVDMSNVLRNTEHEGEMLIKRKSAFKFENDPIIKSIPEIITLNNIPDDYFIDSRGLKEVKYLELNFIRHLKDEA